ncbi:MULTISPECIES: hypothetical protein [Mesorhizobium]|uniref:hypothetical protein n=1 Tax=Mesorhizobium TaxID=68287 RepID=UPI0004224BA7|nr:MULTISPECIES: hypothetical protein [Mesorhizobium]WJI37288.1 hypothetical protein NL534_25945 [Mesorhizobium opportunistum]
MESDLLFSARLKIDRAKHHFRDLNRLVEAFKKREPYSVTVEIDAEPGRDFHRLKVNEAVPREWGGIVGDVIHNLRASLDNLAAALVIANGRTGRDIIENTQFPIGSTKPLFEQSLNKRLRGASPLAKRIVERLKPYKGGTEAFWRLHKLDILDKHTVIVPVAASHSRIGWKFPIPGIMERISGLKDVPMPDIPFMFFDRNDVMYPLNDGDILTSYDAGPDPDRKFKPEFNFVISIAFGEGQIVDGKLLIPSLNELIDFTERVVDIFARYIFR